MDFAFFAINLNILKWRQHHKKRVIINTPNSE